MNTGNWTTKIYTLYTEPESYVVAYPISLSIKMRMLIG